jgi:DNA primase
MQDSAKYLIHADIRASGVVERSDVVGAIFGQTEGLLGDDLDLRNLQDSSKVGRIDVEIESEAGRSYGTVTIASGLDRAETAVLAASLETIDRVGPCRAEFSVTELEDARAAKRREVVDRATELLAAFEDTSLSSRELVEEVRRNVRVADITEYEGLPAGPRVTDSDSLIVVEGRADVLQLLRYGIKTAIAVEGTDVPDAVADLSHRRTVTTFLDGDRGGDLILKELAQVGSVDYVTFAPAGKSVEDLSREEVLSALRKKAPYDQLSGTGSPRDAFAGETHPAGAADDRTATAGDGGSSRAAAPAPETDDRTEASSAADSVEAVADTGGGAQTVTTDEPEEDGDTPADADTTGDDETAGSEAAAETVDDTSTDETTGATAEADTEPQTLSDHVSAVTDTGTVRLLDDDFEVVAEDDAGDAFDAVADAEAVPATVILDGSLSQRVLDVAAQRGVGLVVATETGEFVKQPTGVRIRTADEF